MSLTFLGTCQHRDTHLTALLQSFKDIEYYANDPNSPVAARLFDGPGCMGSREHPRPGTYVYAEGKKTIPTRRVFSTWLHAWTTFMNRSYSVVTAEGVESTLFEASLYLEELIKQNGGILPKVVNLQGFSRGADTCVRFANILNRIHPDIKVNLLLFDPVPGPGRRDDLDSYIVPANVNEFRASLMLNEHKSFFKPQHQGRYFFQGTHTKVAINTHAGTHGAALSTNDNDARTPLSTQILNQDSLLSFNLDHGALPEGACIEYRHKRAGQVYTYESLPPNQKRLSSKQRFQYFCQSMDAFRALNNRFVVNQSVYYSRTIMKDRLSTLLDPDLFLDAEHRALFKTTFPACFHWFFEKNHGDPKYTKRQVFRELNTLKQSKYGDFYQRFLNKFQMHAIQKPEDIIAPQGIYGEEQSTYLQPLVYDDVSYLRYSLSTITNYYHYHCQSSDRSSRSDVLSEYLKEQLRQSRTMSNEDAKQYLIASIKQVLSHSTNQDFIHQEVSKIVYDSEHYYLMIHKTLLGFDGEPIDQARKLIGAIAMDNTLDFYQKRQKINTCLIDLHSHILGADSDAFDEDLQKLSNNLAILTKPSYAEHYYIDHIIHDLESYIFWRSFLACFPKQFGYDPIRIKNAQSVLAQVKVLKTQGNDLMAVQKILQRAYESSGRPPYHSSDPHLWKHHLYLRFDYFNTMMLKHLKKITAITSIFSHQDHYQSAPFIPRQTR